ncbi:substrate-binding domain-containing protein [Deinococcus sp. S9]|uniref:substrate-binding domain-containing protein n=1 Tax=Deinococcus sp. S9 TaxID=2545754 RepID=UPI001055737B|nr:substrate-binding domain-containing protein [Deinococcus sp. S9]TDE84622.1 hypothetical protein E0686_16190 [Deinococcus sp. S9]
MEKIAALTLLALASAALAQNVRIVVVTHGQASDPFWSVVKNGVDQAAKDMNVKVEYRSPQTFDMVQMSQLINAAVASKPDGIVVSIPEAAALSKAITAATKAGIPVVSINSGADVFKKFGVLMHVGQEEFAAGRGAGARMKALGVKNPICLNHEVGNAGLDQRCAGFSEGFGRKVPVVAVKSDFTEVRNAVALST